jgi:predicted 3-demethylubiquinone-9 3-methyltransferase (glyoxalase superfamily)
MKATACLMFQGNAMAALALWHEAFPELKALEMQEHPAGFSLFFADCDDETRLRRLTGIPGEGGQTMMPLSSYGISALFTWFADRYAVSRWPLNLP